MKIRGHMPSVSLYELFKTTKIGLRRLIYGTVDLNVD